MTILIAALCSGAMLRLVSLPPQRALVVFDALAVVPDRLFAVPFAPGQAFTLLTSAFLHAGWLHLGGNMLFLAVFGPTVEQRLGHRSYAALYLLSGIAGAFVHAYLNAGSVRPLVGASGAIAGVLGAHLVVAPRERITTLVPVGVFFEVASLPAAFVIGLWFLLQVASGFAPVVPGTDASSIAWYAHLAGFALGLVLAVPGALGSRGGRRAKRR